MSAEFGPWVEHDGSGRPAPIGTVAYLVFANGDEGVGTLGERFPRRLPYSGPLYCTSWDWSGPGSCVPIIRYRLSRPPAVRLLVDIAETLPAGEHEDA